MPLDREDATRIIRFCLAGVGWGAATHEEDAYVVKVVRSDDGKTAAARFEGRSYEEALREAARAGSLNPQCVEKQMSFLGRLGQVGRAGGVLSGGTHELVANPGVTEAARHLALGPPLSDAAYQGLTQAISAFLTESQRERGMSSLYLASAARRFGSRLLTQWKVADSRLNELKLVAERYRARISEEVRSRLNRAMDLAATMAAGRPAIESLAVSAVATIAGYSLMNGEFLAVIDALATRSVTPAARPTALAWMALLHAKEKTGIERALLSSAFARDRYADGQHAAVSALIAASDSYLHLFAAAAPAAAEALLRETLRSDVAEAVADMERIALRKHDGGFGVDPEAWFMTVSQKMDRFGDVESVIRASLTASP
jgi:Nitrate and nitrite sensing